MDLILFSLNPANSRRQMRAYEVDGISHVGVELGESYGIRFRNTSGERLQVRLSVDGTDVLTGDKATLDPSGKMWVVRPYDLLELTAWPETTQGGASFVFTSQEDSVAAHTHGDTSAKGIISAAVFTEGYRPPQPMTLGGIDGDMPVFRGATRGGGTFGSESYGATRSLGTKGAVPEGVGTGAGEFRQLRVGHTQGLVQPTYSELVRLRVILWTDLVDRLHVLGVEPEPSFPTGFEPPRLANLGSTPRQGTSQGMLDYSRFV